MNDSWEDPYLKDSIRDIRKALENYFNLNSSWKDSFASIAPEYGFGPIEIDGWLEDCYRAYEFICKNFKPIFDYGFSCQIPDLAAFEISLPKGHTLIAERFSHVEKVLKNIYVNETHLLPVENERDELITVLKEVKTIFYPLLREIGENIKAGNQVTKESIEKLVVLVLKIKKCADTEYGIAVSRNELSPRVLGTAIFAKFKAYRIVLPLLKNFTANINKRKSKSATEQSISIIDEKKLGNRREIWRKVKGRKIYKKVIAFPKTLTSEFIKVGVVQIDYDLKGKIVVDEKKVLEKIKNVVEIAHNKELDLLVLPELAGSKRIDDFLKTSSRSMLILGPSRMLRRYNQTKVWYETDSYIYRKLHRSKWEDSTVLDKEMKLGNELLFFLQPYSFLLVPLICADFPKEVTHILESRSDFVIASSILGVSSFNPGSNDYRQEASNKVERSGSYIIISNTSKFGFSAIYGSIDQDPKLGFIKDLTDRGLRDPSSPKNELARIKQGEEGILCAKLNYLQPKATKSTSTDSEEYANVREVKEIKL